MSLNVKAVPCTFCGFSHVSSNVSLKNACIIIRGGKATIPF